MYLVSMNEVLLFNLYKNLSPSLFLLSSRDGLFASTCRAFTSEILKAPVYILMLSLCLFSSFFNFLAEAVVHPLWRWICCCIFSRFHPYILFGFLVCLCSSPWTNSHKYLLQHLYSLFQNAALYFLSFSSYTFSLPCCEWWILSCSSRPSFVLNAYRSFCILADQSS